MVPGRTQAWKEQVIRNTSEDQFRQEFECVAGNTFVDIRHKITGIVEKIKIVDLYNRM
jgi:uncharacterized membrane-anchored protein